MSGKKGFNSSKSLCKLSKLYKDNRDEYKVLVRDSKWVCSKCGRVAVWKKNLCEPEKLD